MKTEQNDNRSGHVSRRTALQAFAMCGTDVLLSASPLHLAVSIPNSVLRFGLIADSHYAKTVPKGTRFYEGVKEKMQASIEEFNAQELDFIVHLGDMKDQGPDQDPKETLKFLKDIERVFQKFIGPKYHCVGNHDVDSITKQQFLEFTNSTAVKTEKGYYSYDLKGYHFVVLDANFDEHGNDHFYLEGADWQNTHIPDDQLAWLRADLMATTKPTLVFCHHPLYFFECNEHIYHIQNYKIVQSLLEDSKKVQMVFQGHVHERNVKEINGIQYVTLLGMVDYDGLDNNAFSIVSLKKDLCKMTGYARSQNEVFELA